MPGLHVLWVDLGSLVAVGDDALVVFIGELHGLLVRLEILVLPKAKLLVADALQLWIYLLRILYDILKESARLLVVVLTAWGSLDVVSISDRYLDHCKIVGELLVLLFDREYALASLITLLGDEFLLTLIELNSQLI